MGVDTIQAVNTAVDHSTLQWSQMQQMKNQQVTQQQVWHGIAIGNAPG